MNIKFDAIRFAKLLFFIIILCPSFIRADVVTYDLQDTWLLPDITRPREPARQMFGTFEWTFVPGDFENGAGRFVELETPWYNPGIDNLNITIEPSAIEFSLQGNYHDLGLDLTMFALDPIAPNQSSTIDLVRSQFEIQNGTIWQGHFISGSLVARAIPEPSTMGIVGLSVFCMSLLGARRR